MILVFKISGTVKGVQLHLTETEVTETHVCPSFEVESGSMSPSIFNPKRAWYFFTKPQP